MDEYLGETDIGGNDKSSPLFRTAASKIGTLTDRRMTRTDALRMIWAAQQRPASQPSWAAIHSARPASRSTCKTEAYSNTRSKWQRTKAPGRHSSTIAAATRSRSIRLRRSSYYKAELPRFGHRIAVGSATAVVPCSSARGHTTRMGFQSLAHAYGQRQGCVDPSHCGTTLELRARRRGEAAAARRNGRSNAHSAGEPWLTRPRAHRVCARRRGGRAA